MESADVLLLRKQQAKKENRIQLEAAAQHVHAISQKVNTLDVPVARLPLESEHDTIEISQKKIILTRESESADHINAKERIRNIAIKSGKVAANEVLFPCWSYYHDHPVIYRADVYVFDPVTKRQIIQEVHGYKGHDSSKKWFKDRIRRVDDIQMWYGDNIEFPEPIDLDSLRMSTPLDIMKSMGFDT